ncbi:MAG TPA: hypothetical protein VFA07_16040 [Chthonomonadaceae bacterium]|nr:hypothetical protein [Chthonomonadaceae bacterium]
MRYDDVPVHLKENFREAFRHLRVAQSRGSPDLNRYEETTLTALRRLIGYQEPTQKALEGEQQVSQNILRDPNNNPRDPAFYCWVVFWRRFHSAKGEEPLPPVPPDWASPAPGPEEAVIASAQLWQLFKIIEDPATRIEPGLARGVLRALLMVLDDDLTDITCWPGLQHLLKLVFPDEESQCFKPDDTRDRLRAKWQEEREQIAEMAGGDPEQESMLTRQWKDRLRQQLTRVRQWLADIIDQINQGGIQ